MMLSAFRHRVASGALALTALQFVLLFAAPMSCCVPGSARMKTEAATVAASEECPLHHKSKDLGSRSETQDLHCRMMCDAPHGPQFLLGAIGVLAAPAAAHFELASFAMPAVAALSTTVRPAIPDAPPPRLL